ncbi:MAG: hypothetical protein ACI9UT_001911 [Flavobacteriales bacterium]|jgi:hypothetical protein
MLDKNNHSSYTVSVDLLVNAISGVNPEKPSLYQQAADYFTNVPVNKQKLTQLKTAIRDTQLLLQIKSGKSARILEHQLNFLNKKYEVELLSQQTLKTQRLNHAIDVCLDILSLTEGEDFEATQLKSARFLTTLVLFSPEQSKKLAELHHSLKPAYKAVLSIRVLDKLVGNGRLKNHYIVKNYAADKRYEPERTDCECYTQAVILPIMLAAIFQDVGLQHPALTELLEGTERDKDRFRLLEVREREEMLALNYQHTIDYIKNGLGCQQAGTDEEQDIANFDKAEQKRLKFQLGLISDANSSKRGTSEIIKIPQIYASIIFSTKRDYQRKNLPTASILIAQLAIKKVISPQVSDAFVSIVGQFPLGFGITYIAQNMNGGESDFYEYGIVTRLNPAKKDQPICRLVTKNLMFLPHGKTGIIKKEHNLHFQSARKKLVKIDPKRLAEVMQHLSYNYGVEEIKPIIPYYWEPHIYFCVQGNQNLWSNTN